MPRLKPATGLLLALALTAAGCSRYQLGTGSRPTFASLGVEPVVNRTALPQAEALVSARLREAFIRDGRVPTVASGAAAVLSVTLSDFRREVAAVREGDTGLARKFNLTLSASATLRETESGRLLWDRRTFTVTREAFTDGGQLQSEYQTLPLLAEALAQRVALAALDSW
jgi:hypothetical protein